MAMHCDPLKLLIEFLNSKGIRPVDLFRTFEQDEQHRVSRRNFIAGLKKAKVPLEDRDLEKVVDRLAGPSGGKLSYQVLTYLRIYKTLGVLMTSSHLSKWVSGNCRSS